MVWLSGAYRSTAAAAVVVAVAGAAVQMLFLLLVLLSCQREGHARIRNVANNKHDALQNTPCLGGRAWLAVAVRWVEPRRRSSISIIAVVACKTIDLVSASHLYNVCAFTSESLLRGIEMARQKTAARWPVTHTRIPKSNGDNSPRLPSSSISSAQMRICAPIVQVRPHPIGSPMSLVLRAATLDPEWLGLAFALFFPAFPLHRTAVKSLQRIASLV